ncbi:MAG: methyltransferase domain-containing protein [Patescibacteria group bacterium]
MHNNRDLNKIVEFVLSDNTTDYGYYGSKALIPKRLLWWERIKIAHNLYKRYEKGIDKDVLVDFGCQFAFLSTLLSKEFNKVCLVETSQHYVDLGVYMHDKLGNGNYETIINSKDNSSEFIDKIKCKVNLFLFFDVLEHVKNVKKMLADLKKISGNNTYLIVSLPTENFIYNLLTKFKKEKGHINRYFEVENALRESGYKLLEKKSLLLLFNIYLYKYGESC